MGIIEKTARKRTRRNTLRAMILNAIETAGTIHEGLLRRNVIGAMEKAGMIPSGRQNQVVRSSCFRMVHAGLLEWHDKRLQLTRKGEAVLRRLKLRLYDVQSPQHWDRKWRVLIFDIPEHRRNLRNNIRDTLRAIGFICLQKKRLDISI